MMIMFFIQNTYYAAGDIAICGTRGWDIPESCAEWSAHDEKIYQRELGRLRLSLESAKRDGRKRIIAAVHYPPVERRHRRTGFTEILEEFGVEKVIFGHLHGQTAHRNAFTGISRGIEYRLVSCDYSCTSGLYALQKRRQQEKQSMNEQNRVILIVMDSVGAGALPDAGRYGDEGRILSAISIPGIPVCRCRICRRWVFLPLKAYRLLRTMAQCADPMREWRNCRKAKIRSQVTGSSAASEWTNLSARLRNTVFRRNLSICWNSGSDGKSWEIIRHPGRRLSGFWEKSTERRDIPSSTLPPTVSFRLRQMWKSFLWKHCMNTAKLPESFWWGNGWSEE